MAMTPTTASTASTSSPAQTYRGPFAIMTVLFFMWGFMTVFNDILMPRFKEAFTLDYPPGAISLLHGISTIGDKFHAAGSSYGHYCKAPMSRCL
jgi:hypothetical protein